MPKKVLVLARACRVFQLADGYHTGPHRSFLSWQVYERAIANIPPAPEKRYWQRYIYLWINYALFEELEAQDMDRTREVYRACLKLIPHKAFTFAKVLCGIFIALEHTSGFCIFML